MVRIATIARHKENIAPRREGHDINALNANMPTHDGPDTSIDSFEAPEVPDEDSEDPLYASLLTIEQLQSSHFSQTVFRELLEEMLFTVQRFQDYDQYKQDRRFVKLCLKYGSHSESPPSMFEFMESSEIGTQLSMLYEQWANYLETVNETEQAQCVLHRGIARDAQPQLQLQIALNNLKQRCSVKSRVNLPVKVAQSRITKPSSLQTRSHRRLDLYVDNGEIDESSVSSSSNISLPIIPQEKKENIRTAHPLVASTRGIPTLRPRTLQVFQDTQEHAISLDDDFGHLTYNEQMLRCRTFDQPVRSFDPSCPLQFTVRTHAPLKKRRTVVEQVGPDLHAAIYQQHEGVTEPIGRAILSKNGDTEVLK